MTAATVDLVVAVHDVRRPLERTIRSVLDDDTRDRTGVVVVRHGLGAGAFADLEARTAGRRARWVGHDDGVRSPAGPYNAGIRAATADYVGVMGSDDVLEPGAVKAMLRHLDEDAPDVLVLPLRHADGEPVRSPLSRPFRTRRLDPVKDRLAYRTAPLAVVRRELWHELNLSFTEGMATGEDVEVSARLWFSGARIDFHPRDPGYVIMTDGPERVTSQVRPLAYDLEPFARLLTLPEVAVLSASARRGLAVKTLRVHLLAALDGQERRGTLDQPAVDAAGELVRRALRLAPGALAPFSRADRTVLDVLAAHGARPETVLDAVRARRGAGTLAHLLPADPVRMLDRESTVRRYGRYATWARRPRYGGGS